MQISITDEAKKYIKHRGGEVVVSTVAAKGCCGAMIREPVISTKLPEGIENYRRFNSSGIIVHIPRHLALKESGLLIRLGGFWKWRYLTVEGVKCSL